MNELINLLKKITSLSELKNLNSINPNILLYAIAKSERYDLLKNTDLKLNINDNKTLEELIDLFLSDEDILYYMQKNGFAFSKNELDTMFNIVFQKYQHSYKFECFFKYFFTSKAELNIFVTEHKQFFENYINKEYIQSPLKDCDSIVELILKKNRTKLIRNLENYSLSNLKLLVQFLKQNNNLPYYIGNDSFAKHLFDLKSDLNAQKFCTLMNLLKEKSYYDRKHNNTEISFFTNLIIENIDYLIDMVSQTNFIPKCLTESSVFRDECIKRNRFDLAVKCILPPNIMQDEKLVNAYCNELDIDVINFYERIKWLVSYSESNNNIFNTFLATSLKDNIFSFNKEHYERFINDVEVQISISKLSDKELIALSKILNIYDYKEYDISPMIVNIIKNIGDYKELITSLDFMNISDQTLRKLVGVLQLPKNEYQIDNMEALQNYKNKKRKSFENNFNSNDLVINKNNLLKVLFNIDLIEAQYINSKYCYNNDNNNILDNLKNSELPQQIYNYLLLINKIVECDNLNDLSTLYNSLKDNNIYESEIPFESYLRGKYTELYSKSLYRIDEKKQVYGPTDSIFKEANYEGKKIQICIPRVNFNFFIHCVGSCSLASDVTDTNYKNDWLNRPQIQDHFVACSYINEKGIYSIRSQGNIIFGFATLENSSILGMGNTDIDSIGREARIYNSSHELQEGNGNRARYFVPSEILKTINNGYNEIVVERRNTDPSKSKEFKRKPDYIIMMAESLEQKNFNRLETLYQDQLSFILEEDKKEIQKIGDSKKLKNFLLKYKNIIAKNAEIQSISLNNMANTYVDLIMKAKYYEDCLKASSEFNIPLIVIDKTYYFNKILTESDIYDEETRSKIVAFYSEADESKRKQMFNMAAKKCDLTKFIQPNESQKISITI